MVYFWSKGKARLTKPLTQMSLKTQKSIRIKKHVKQFVKKVYGNAQNLPMHLGNEFGQDLAETAILDMELSGKALDLANEMEIDETLFERIFLRAMLFWTLSRTALGFTAKDSIEAFLIECEIPETLYPLENALRQYQRHRPRE